MIGLPPRLCCFCGTPATADGLFFDYRDRARYVCDRHLREVSPADRDRLLIACAAVP